MNTHLASLQVSWQPADNGARTLHQHDALNRFFAGIERRALRYAEIAVRNREDALDLVQVAMIKLARNYAKQAEDEWAPLFYRILQNGIRDHHRRHAVRNRVMVWFGGAQNAHTEQDLVNDAPDPAGRTPDQRLENAQAMQSLETALQALPARQREAFMLRALEGLDVAETANAMGVTAGSVKTHYSRAVHSLRETLGEHWS